jgi:hypothetical protein
LVLLCGSLVGQPTLSNLFKNCKTPQGGGQ